MAGKEEEVKVKVLGKWPSPFSNRVDLALRLKGVKYEFSDQDLKNKSEELLRSNPVHKKVPVLLHDGRAVAESLVIVEYIDDTWKQPHPLLPHDPYLRAQARFWTRVVDEKCLPALWNACWSDEKGREKAVKEAIEALKLLETELGDKKFFGGDDVGIVDIAANFVGHWVEMLQEIPGLELLTSEKFPMLYKWSKEFSNHPAIKEGLPPRDKLYAFFKPQFA